MAVKGAGPRPLRLTPVAITRLEKAATDNGFDLELEHTSDWLSFGSSQTSMRIWLTARGESRFLSAMSRSDVLKGLDDLGVVFTDLLPSGAVGAASVRDIAALHRLLRRAFQLSRTLPDALLHAFENEIANLPRTTEAERLVVRRVGQDIFRRGLLEYWDGRCAITGLDVPALLRASHIKPWADCDTDAERLDVYNGLLLAPHLDAAFDCGFITVAEDGTVLVSDFLPSSARLSLGLDGPLRVDRLHCAHERYLPWHRTKSSARMQRIRTARGNVSRGGRSDSRRQPEVVRTTVQSSVNSCRGVLKVDDLNINVNINAKVPALEKLLDYTASGIGAVATPLLAPYVAHQRAKAKLIEATADADSLRLIADAQADAKRALLTSNDGAKGTLEITQAQIAQRLEFQEHKRHRNIASAVRDAATELEGETVADHEPDHDWTARFFEYVQDVSTEDVRIIWSRILAGEVRSPGGVSMHTLSILRNLSSRQATLFTEAMRYCIGDFIVKDACLRVSDVLTNYDLTFGFEDLGLFRSPINARPARQLSLGRDGINDYVNANHILILEGVKNRGLGIDGNVVLKPPAVEIARFCNPEADFRYLAELAKRLAAKNCVLKAAPIESTLSDGRHTYSKNKIRVIEAA